MAMAALNAAPKIVVNPIDSVISRPASVPGAVVNSMSRVALRGGSGILR